MNKALLVLALTLSVLISSNTCILASDINPPVYMDAPFLQDYSVKYYFTDTSNPLLKIYADRNDVIQLLSTKGLLMTHGGTFLYPGTVTKDRTYRPMGDKEIINTSIYKQQFVYLDNVAVFSNAWAGSLFLKHGMEHAKLFKGGKDFSFLVSDGKNIKYIQSLNQIWKVKIDDEIINIRYTEEDDLFWILGKKTLSTYSPLANKLQKIFTGDNFTSFDLVAFNSKTIIGTNNGYIEVNNISKTQIGEVKQNLPCNKITVVEEINGNVWFGSTLGAFMLRDDGKFNYYNGERWLPGNQVKHISKGPEKSVLILTEKGVGQICFKKMTLEDKAMFFEKQVRKRHIRNGFNATLSGLNHGDLSTGILKDSDNDGLWTSMYLGGEIFRYAVTKSDDALQNCIEALDAMERLYTINPVPGFPSRSFERSGYISVLSDPHRWQHTDDLEWDWKSTTSSDEAIGHIFAMGAFAELITIEPLRTRAVHIIDMLMQHIVDNDFYMVDFDGKPTTWGKWNPDYVNARPKMVGDRKINSSNIIAMLQTAYYFTKKEAYKTKAFELMDDHGYLENLMVPMNNIAMAPDDADDWSKMLSESWNHSDDEMYFVGYWGLYRYAFNNKLKEKFKEAIIDHWEIERPEKDGAWNLFTALVSNQFDLDEAIWYLKEHPLDLISWDIMNSHRKDIELLEPNFREQTTKEVLPPDERPIQRHNGNMFRLDKKGGNGTSENSAGDIWLLPYWLGRYLGVISEPVETNR